MDITSIIGIVIGFGAIIAGFILEGGSLASLVHEISPFVIIFGGTAGATILSFSKTDLKMLPGLLKKVFTNQVTDEIGIINQLSDLSEKARKEGLLSLEQETQTIENPLIKKGLALVVDGIETQAIKDILERDSELRGEIYETGAKIFEFAGGVSPTMGVCGTVLGMINILKDMSSPAELGPKISVAFIATLFGVGFANLAFIPIAGKIKSKAAKEAMVNDIIIEGLLSIQAGENPRLIKEKLNLSLLEQMSGKKSSSNSSNDASAREVEA
jgi:Flagellar motor component